MQPPLQGNVKACQRLITQLRAAMDTAKEIGDPTVIYVVARALHACVLRWNNEDQEAAN
jgi:hypothetical protein